MGEIISLDDYKNKKILAEIAELRKKLDEIMSEWETDEPTGYFLSLEDMAMIEAKWLEEKRKL